MKNKLDNCRFFQTAYEKLAVRAEHLINQTHQNTFKETLNYILAGIDQAIRTHHFHPAQLNAYRSLLETIENAEKNQASDLIRPENPRTITAY